MSEIKVSVDDFIIASVKEFIEPLGFDVEIIVKILLNRIAREHSLDFLLVKEKTKEKNKFSDEESILALKSNGDSSERKHFRDMRKPLAISIFRNKGIMFNTNITFASKNRAANNYWANPTFESLDHEWFLILNDWINNVLYLFKVPACAISKNALVARADNNSQIDLQILYNDVNFRDTRSNYIFKKYYVMSEKY